MVILSGIIGSIIATVIYNSAKKGKIKDLYRVVKSKPFETFTVISLCVVLLGITKLIFLQE